MRMGVEHEIAGGFAPEMLNKLGGREHKYLEIRKKQRVHLDVMYGYV